MRAFIFSLDAFVAFTLALIAVYSLIFFSSVPSGYYATLAQAHGLATDGLEALSLTECKGVFGAERCGDDISLLEYLAYRSADGEGDIRFILDDHIPVSFGYGFETSDDGGSGWNAVYDSKNEAGSKRPKEARKLSVSAYAVTFQYSDPLTVKNPYSYKTCDGGIVACGVPTNNLQLGSANVRLIRLVVYT